MFDVFEIFKEIRWPFYVCGLILYIIVRTSFVVMREKKKIAAAKGARNSEDSKTETATPEDKKSD